MKEAIIFLLKEYDGKITIADFGVNYQGALITDAILTAEEELQFWSGNPELDHSAQIIPDEETTNHLYDLIIDSFWD